MIAKKMFFILLKEKNKMALQNFLNLFLYYKLKENHIMMDILNKSLFKLYYYLKIQNDNINYFD